MTVRKFRFPRIRLYGFQNHRFMEDPPAGESEGGAGEGGEKGAAGEGEGGGGKTIPPELQPAVDKIIQSRLAKEKAQNTKLASELKSLQASANLSKEQQESLSAQIETLETSLQTETEKAQGEQKKLQAKYDKDTKALGEERDLWKGRFETASLTRALTDAAVEAGAEHPGQIAMMFGGNAKLVQDQADGKPIESFTGLLSFTGLGEDGKTQETMELPIAKAIAKIRDDGLNANLFKHGAKSGTGTPPSGGTGGTGGTKTDRNTPPDPKDYDSTESWQKAYDDWRKEHKHGSVTSQV